MVALRTHRPFAGKALPSPLRYYGLMCQSCCLPSTMHGDSSMDLCSLDHPLLVNRTFPTLSLRIFPWMPGPLPRRLLWCSCPFLPMTHRPSPTYQRVGSSTSSAQRLQSGLNISRLQSFHHVQLPRFACHPDRSHLYAYGRRAVGGVYIRAPRDSLPPPASDMLVVRIGQLTT